MYINLGRMWFWVPPSGNYEPDEPDVSRDLNAPSSSERLEVSS